MNHLAAYILIAVSANGNVGMQEFEDEQACSSAALLISMDMAKGTDTSATCVPKATPKKPEQPKEEKKS